MTTTRRDVMLASLWLSSMSIAIAPFAARPAWAGGEADLDLPLRTMGPVDPNAFPPPVGPAAPAATASARAGDRDHDRPSEPPAPARIELAYRRFGIGNLDTTSTIPLQGLELSLFPLSGRWLRAGFELGAGSGQASMSGTGVDLRYGLAGLVAGLQLPAGRIVPFVEGRLVGGVLAGTLDGALSIPGTSYSLSGGSAATWIHGRGVDVGASLYASRRLHLTASVGWLRTTWRGPDVAAMTANPGGGLQTSDLTSDGFTARLGIGF